MTENQGKQLMKLMNNCISGINELREGQKRLEDDVSELKSDVSELKEGQKRIEAKIGLNDRVVNTISGEQYRINERLSDLEQPQA